MRSKPSSEQFKMLLDLLEEHRWLATSHARTTFARVRTRETWQKMTVKLNSDVEGCLKSWQQWCKYWKDKKAAIKRKASVIQMARKTGNVDEDMILTPNEERVYKLMTGKVFGASYSQNLNTETEESEHNLEESILPDSEDMDLLIEMKQEITSENESENSGNFLQEPLFNPSQVAECELQDSPDIQQMPEDSSSSLQFPPSEPINKNASSIGSSCRHRQAGPRQLVHRPRQALRRRTHLANLTERFIAIEEKRATTDLLLAQNQRDVIAALRQMNEAWLRQSQALQDLVNLLKNKGND